MMTKDKRVWEGARFVSGWRAMLVRKEGVFFIFGKKTPKKTHTK